MFTFIKRYWPSILVFFSICWLTLAPEPVGEVHIELFAGADKVVHACMMGGLTAVMLVDAWRIDCKIPTVKSIVTIAFAVVIFSALDECAQDAMAYGRRGEIGDFVADICGVVIALLTSLPVLRVLERKNFPESDTSDNE